MKIMKSILAIFLIAISLVSFSQNVTIDAKNSSVKWHGKKVTGEHMGAIQLKSGAFELVNNKIASGVFAIDMTSITNSDIEDEGYNTKLVGHLKSDDFFSVEKFPVATLKITGSSAFTNNSCFVEGDLTIKGITHPISFEVKKENGNYKSELVIDRSKFDVKYGSGSFFEGLGDKMIYDEFTLSIVLAPAK